ncbi:MAG: GDP-mannose 4,6-dehydratase [Dolichospermum sp. WA123]|nr:GDP-mannose 4,6-dehydratase [Dolichospermum sp. WA123]
MGNLDARRDWCYAKDTVYAMWLMLLRLSGLDCTPKTNTLFFISSGI